MNFGKSLYVVTKDCTFQTIYAMSLFFQAEDNMIRKFFSPTVSPYYLPTSTLSIMRQVGNNNEEDTLNAKINEDMDISTGMAHQVNFHS